MASMLAMASARSAPMAKPETPPAGDSTERFGVGVTGGGGWLEVWEGAGGTAGVLGTRCAGVAGGAAAAAEGAAAAGLGCCGKG